MERRNSGSALIYILVAIALLAVLTATLMEPSNQQSQSQGSANTITEISSQISLISSTIQECVLSYPDQDSSLTATEQKNPPYPINPRDSYFASSTPATAANNSALNIRCPGNPGGTGATRKNHAKMFGGNSGKFLPPAPNLFQDWEYYNGADGVFIVTGTNKTDAYLASALAKLDAKYAKCESDVIDATGSAVNLSSDTVGGASGVRQCASGYRCFRYWIVQKPTAVGAETGCPD
jgi:hypothetical protein